MKLINLIIGILIICLINSCSNNGAKPIEDKIVKKEKELIKFVRLYESFIDATFEWHKQTNYNIVLKSNKEDDTLSIKIYGVASGDIWPIQESKYCYLIDNHYVFSDTLLHSIETVSIDSICKTININLYQEYMRTKRPPPLTILWDCETLKIQYIREQLSNVQFIWGE